MRQSKRRSGRSERLTASIAAGALALSTTSACRRRVDGSSGTTNRPDASARMSSAAASSARAPSATSPRPPPPAATELTEERLDAGPIGLTFSDLSDVGPAAPATASAEGVVLVTRSNRLAIARSASGALRNGRLLAVSEPNEAFAPLAKAPALAGGFAHWISGGRVLRRRLDGSGDLDVMADDARDATRVAAAERAAGVVALAYVGRPDAEGTSRARLRVGPSRALDLTPEGAGASSVALVALGDRSLAVSVDGRTSMTPLHARIVAPNGELGPDVVAWVAGPAHPWTEVFASSDGTNAWAHLPIERDATHFGLATVSLGSEPNMDAPVSFLDYPNGIDLAPVASARLCKKTYIAFARPSAARPRSPQELVLREVEGSGTSVVATASGFAGVSMAPLAGGGLIAYVADGRTWARGVRCD